MTTLDHPARDDAARGPVRIPFPVVDEVSRHCLQEEEPETVHIEVHLPGRLAPDRLRAAFTEALHRHPRILMREAPAHWYSRRYEWELTKEPEVEVVSFPPPGPHALRDARTRSLTQAPPLSLSPPIRLEVVAGAGPAELPEREGTVLFLTINHTALDGPACLRILATAAELYGGEDNAPTAPPVRATTPDLPLAGPETPSTWAPPARVAPGTPEPSPGNGLLVTELPVPRRPRSAPYTVNDQLMVTTALMLAHWNREHGARPRPFRITMPVDDRPRDTRMPIGNGTRLVDVAFLPEEVDQRRTPTAVLLRRTADRTRALKSLARPQLGHGASLLTAPVVPVSWRAALTRGLRRAAAPWTSTTLLSNIGRIPYSLDFGQEAGRAHAVWFSAPARMPRGLTVTTASTAGRLHLALRWSRALLGHGDGAHLRDLFEHYLHATEEDTP
ncbi:condensation protein [Streptomyces neyagawaensis]|uniref:condensation protein n=1 Tax=Streptomyces neyagawaensis TaxID=42238 RepID=UPI00201D2877|nr:condensation protein [Streptomyces neyagawaensis]MCL6732847.1 condensation protein [Streptomyces neyagawaensis]MDE1681384.1 condensation protein [Streptomyces neyagawaensis]